MISGLLPVFTILFNLSYLLAGVVAMVFNVTSSILQPLLGHWFDRSQAAWLLEAGLILNCIGMGLVGFSPNYVLLLFLIGTAGFGSAAFHPPAFSAVLRSGGSSKGGAMGLFVSGGNTGMFLGPIVAGALVSFFGAQGTIAMLPVGFVTAALLFRAHLQKNVTRVKVPTKPYPANMRLVVLLAVITALRSVSIQSVVNFLPLYFVKIGDPLLIATAITSLWLGLGVLGQLAGGFLADRIGGRSVVVMSLLLGGLFFYGFLITKDYLSLILLAVSGALLYASWAEIVVMSTEAAPNNVGAISGFMLGFSVGIGGLAAVGFGAVGDVLGLTYAFYLVAASALLGGVVALFLPRRSNR
jgi:FSR family fosmidomycin resistance protein-like MFS transporter